MVYWFYLIIGLEYGNNNRQRALPYLYFSGHYITVSILPEESYVVCVFTVTVYFLKDCNP